MDKILYYSCLGYTPSVQKKLEEHFYVIKLKDPRFDTRLTQSDKKKIRAVFCPLGWRFDEYWAKGFHGLRYLVSNTTTTTHIKYKEENIISLRGAQLLGDITSTAEHTIGLIMALHRSIPGASKAVHRGIWNRFDWGAPKMLSKMTLGILGMGRVGHHLEKICKPIFKNVGWWEPDSGERDVIAICASVRPEDRQPIFGTRELRLMKPDALLINTARPELLDHDALLSALKGGTIRGAALDCLPNETRPLFLQSYSDGSPMDSSIEKRLVNYAKLNNNLIITPHIAGSTQDAWEATQGYVVDELIRRMK